MSGSVIEQRKLRGHVVDAGSHRLGAGEYRLLACDLDCLPALGMAGGWALHQIGVMMGWTGF